MPTVRFRQSIAANATENIDLTPHDRFGARGGQATLYAVGTADGSHRATLIFGDSVAIDRGFMNVAGTAGIVDRSVDGLGGGFGAPFDPLTLRIENTTGAPAICQGIVDIS